VSLIKKVLTIAGSDSGGGAGIQADLKSFAARGVYGTCAITALTAQNTLSVDGIFIIRADFVGKQIDSVMNDIGADAWKTGMLVNDEIIKVVSEKTIEYNMEKLIIDPVMVAKSGDFLLQKEAINALKTKLIPLAYIITPNHHEAEVITKKKINNLIDTEKAAKLIYNMGAKNVLIKGGHIPHIKDAIDILYDGNEISQISAERIDTKNTHGTGCTYASLIAAEIAKGKSVKSAVHNAKIYLTDAILSAKNLKIGKGHGPLNHFFNFKFDQ